ncbi:MAG TPA: STAS domain-containing protein [Thermoleophilaceae bacterium]|nr:STAS domain-containing protein [Thermoleophilaceae bacterium]
MSVPDLEIRRTEDHGVHVVEPKGDIDLARARELGSVLREELAERPDEVVVDLSETTHLDSSGVAVLLNAQRRLTRAGSRFAVVAPAGPPRRVLELTGVADTLRMRPAA